MFPNNIVIIINHNNYYKSVCILFLLLAFVLVPTMPTNFEAVTISGRLAVVSWGSPALQNGILISYTLDYIAATSPTFAGCSTNNSTQILRTGDSFQTQPQNVTFSNLCPDTAYKIQVRALTIEGPGDTSALTINTTCKKKIIMLSN